MLRRTGYEIAAIEQFNQSSSELPGSAVRGVTHRHSTERRLRDASDTDDAAASGESVREAHPLRDLGERLVVSVPGWVGTTFQRRTSRSRSSSAGWETDAPIGGRGHVAWFEGDGLHVVDVWESAEAFDAFVNERLMPVVKGELAIPGEPDVRILPAHRQSFPKRLPPDARRRELHSRDETWAGQAVRRPQLTRYDGVNVTGSSGDRAERAALRAADPRNLIWVMPAEERVSDEVVVVVSGGDPPDPESVRAVPIGARVIAADRGLEHALALGLDVEIAVGDFDSASSGAVARAEAAGTRVDRHPTEKDATDLELALDHAVALSPARIVVLAGDGGRLDHLLSTLLLLGSSRYGEVEIDAFIGSARAYVVRRQRAIEGKRGELLSLLALHGPAEGVRTEGLAYALAGETLEPGSSRGVSNLFAAETARISVERGVLLVIRPGVSPDGAKWL